MTLRTNSGIRLCCRGANTGAIWSVQCCPSNGLVAYAGEDGEVAIFKERMLQDNRMRRAHTTVAGPSDLSVNLTSSDPYLPLQHEPLHGFDRHAVCPAATQLLAVCTLLKQLFLFLLDRFLLHARALTFQTTLEHAAVCF